MPEKPVISNPSVGGDETRSSLPFTYSVDVDDPDRAAGLGDSIKEGILRFWKKVEGSYRYLGAKRTTFAARSGTGTQTVDMRTTYEPTELAPLIWLEGSAQILESPNSGGTLSLWNDRSGRGESAFQNTAGNRPVTGGADVGIFKSVNFASGKILDLTVSGLKAPLTVVALATFPIDASEHTLIDAGPAAFRLFKRTDNKLEFNAGSAITASTALTAGAHVITLKVNGAFSSIRVDGTTLATGNPGANIPGGFYVGNDRGFSTPFNGELFAFMVFDRILSPQETLLVESYLARNGPGTTNLPSTSIVKNGFELQPAWTPAVWEGKIAAWFRADKITGLAHGAAVSQWNDQSGNARHAAQATSGNRPLYDTSLGFPAVKFDGANDFLTIPAPAANIPQPITIAAVWNPANSAVVNQHLVSHATVNLEVLSNSSGSLVAYAGTNRLASITRGSNLFSIVTFDHPANQTIIDNNGVQTTLASAGSTLSQGSMNIGASFNGTSNLNGTICELIILPFAITPDDRRNLEGYFEWKYGIAATAPWTNAGPMQPYFNDPWTPSQVTPGVFRSWWTADSITLADGAAVDTWLDSSVTLISPSIATPATATLTERPLFKNPGTANGQKSVDFDGGNDRMPTAFWADRTLEVIFAVIDADSVSGNRTILGTTATGGRTFRLNAGKLQVAKYATADYNTGSTAVVTINTPTLVYVYIEPAQTTYGINGTLETPVAHAQVPTALTVSQLGASAAAEYFDGEIFQIISCGPLGTTARQMVEGALAWQYGIASSLPSTHPYRFARPNFSALGAKEAAWTMEVRDLLGGVDGTGVLGLDAATLAPDGTTNFFVADGANVLVSMPSRLMYRWPRGSITGNYYHDYGIPSLTLYARLLKKRESGEYGLVQESNDLGVFTDGQAISTTWAALGFPVLDWNGDYAIEWKSTDQNGFFSDWHGASYFSTDATPHRPLNLSPGDGIAVTGYPLITFFAEDNDDVPAAATGEIWPFNFVATVGSTGVANSQFNLPRDMAEDAEGKIIVADSTNTNFQVFTSALGFLQRLGAAGAGTGQFAGLTSLASAAVPNGATYELFTGETTNLRIQKFTRTLAGSYAYNTLVSVGLPVYDIAVSNGKVYANTGTTIFEVPLSLAGGVHHAMQNRLPLQIAINDAKQWLYMLQSTPPQIVVIDLTTWQELFTFGSFGTGAEQLYGATMGGGNLKIDQSTGIVYWFDQSNKVIQTYDAYGTLMDWFSIPQGTGSNQHTGAYGILPSRDGTSLYIADAIQDRVQKLSLMSNADIIAFSRLNAEVEVNRLEPDLTFDSNITGVSSPAATGWTKTLAWDGTKGGKSPGSAMMTITAAPLNTTVGVGIYPWASKFNVVPSEDYAFSISGQASTPLLEFWTQLHWYDASDVAISYAPSSPYSAAFQYRSLYATTDFVQTSVRGIAPPGAAYAECVLYFRRTTAAAFSGPQYVWIDDASFGGEGRFLKEATSLGSGAFSWQPTLTEMPIDGTYKIRARAKDAVQSGPWSDIEVIRKVTGPTVIIDSPTSGQVISSVSPLILWRVTAGAQWAFKVQVYSTTTLAIAYDSDWVQSTSARSFMVPPGYLDDGGSYFLRLWIDDGSIKVLV